MFIIFIFFYYSFGSFSDDGVIRRGSYQLEHNHSNEKEECNVKNDMYVDIPLESSTSENINKIGYVENKISEGEEHISKDKEFIVDGILSSQSESSDLKECIQETNALEDKIGCLNANCEIIPDKDFNSSTTSDILENINNAKEDKITPVGDVEIVKKQVISKRKYYENNGYSVKPKVKDAKIVKLQRVKDMLNKAECSMNQSDIEYINMQKKETEINNNEKFTDRKAFIELPNDIDLEVEEESNDSFNTCLTLQKSDIVDISEDKPSITNDIEIRHVPSPNNLLSDKQLFTTELDIFYNLLKTKYEESNIYYIIHVKNKKSIYCPESVKHNLKYILQTKENIYNALITNNIIKYGTYTKKELFILSELISILIKDQSGYLIVSKSDFSEKIKDDKKIYEIHPIEKYDNKNIIKIRETHYKKKKNIKKQEALKNIFFPHRNNETSLYWDIEFYLCYTLEFPYSLTVISSNLIYNFIALRIELQDHIKIYNKYSNQIIHLDYKYYNQIINYIKILENDFIPYFFYENNTYLIPMENIKNYITTCKNSIKKLTSIFYCIRKELKNLNVTVKEYVKDSTTTNGLHINDVMKMNIHLKRMFSDNSTYIIKEISIEELKISLINGITFIVEKNIFTVSIFITVVKDDIHISLTGCNTEFFINVNNICKKAINYRNNMKDCIEYFKI
ncbi:hypothetical protein SLOPH_777 [Spraguea lophii 42_110]|uniref:Uncharacterized protein n=1 Tax=Spraguea lophii (strain 42_110) TaxID=1358809 RepID=S7WCG2_SPRLO|nr:hypothetical protein SLOPH_777 [Spraguea lophii 42_110]